MEFFLEILAGVRYVDDLKGRHRIPLKPNSMSISIRKGTISIFGPKSVGTRLLLLHLYAPCNLH